MKRQGREVTLRRRCSVLGCHVCPRTGTVHGTDVTLLTVIRTEIHGGVVFLSVVSYKYRSASIEIGS